MATPRRNFTYDEIEAVWKKAKVQLNNDPEDFRKDYAGAWIQKSEYGKKTIYGWEIDHEKPLAENGTYDLDNLQPLHWKNNNKKGDNYPGWETEVSSVGIKNIFKIQRWYVKYDDNLF